MNIDDKVKELLKEVSKVQEEDLQLVLDNLGVSSDEAKEFIGVSFFRDSKHDVEYQIINKNTLEVYKHRKIDFNLFGKLGV